MAIAKELRERLLNDVPPLTAVFLELLRQECSVVEIAAKTGYHERTIRKRLSEVRKYLNLRSDQGG